MAKGPVRDPVDREIMDIIPERFDGELGGRGGRRGAKGLILSIALALLLLAALGVAARHLLVGESPQATAEANIPVIKPDEKPIKIKPEDRGGMAVPNQDKLVYQDLNKDEATPQAEKLLPPPEEPKAPTPKSASQDAASGALPGSASQANADIPPPPAIAAKAPAAGTVAKAPAPSAADAAIAQSAANAAIIQPSGPKASAPAAPAANDKPPAQTATDQAPTPLTPVPTQPAAPAAPSSDAAAKKTQLASAATAAPSAPTKPAAADTTQAATPAAPAAPVTAPNASSIGGWEVQLAALKSEGEAQGAWKRIQGANRDLLGTLTLDLQRVDLGAKGVFWRVRAGPLDEIGAKSLCTQLSSRNLGCIVARK
jgi:hypothetical protein